MEGEDIYSGDADTEDGDFTAAAASLAISASAATSSAATSPSTDAAAVGKDVLDRDKATASPRHDIQYTNVVVIGNGPSGISMSYFLSGNWPYYTEGIHPDEYLHARLQDGGKDSIVKQDLEYLSSGLEGRSSNPVALLFDALTHPDADIGMELPSLLSWDYDEDNMIPHVVLGRGVEGGAWQLIECEMQTLSLGAWMELPNMPFWLWLQSKLSTEDSLGQIQQLKRAHIQHIRQYYAEFVRDNGLHDYLRNHCTVTSVERVLDVSHSVDEESGEQKPCTRNHQGKFKWEVRGYEEKISGEGGEVERREFCYRSRNVVLATGTYDRPIHLGTPGEHLPYVFHSIYEMSKLVKSGDLNSRSLPVLIVGAGLSAADAILHALHNNIPVIHIFRREPDDPNVVYSKLPSALYPEYQRVHGMMKEPPEDGYYQSFSMHEIIEFKDDGFVLIRGQHSQCDVLLRVSYAFILIGYEPDLSFLPNEGRQLGIVPGMAIHPKHNPIDVDPYSHCSVHQPGLYAMGPLIGDNFVRFLTGGALAITSHMWKCKTGKL